MTPSAEEIITTVMEQVATRAPAPVTVADIVAHIGGPPFVQREVSQFLQACVAAGADLGLAPPVPIAEHDRTGSRGYGVSSVSRDPVSSHGRHRRG